MYKDVARGREEWKARLGYLSRAPSSFTDFPCQSRCRPKDQNKPVTINYKVQCSCILRCTCCGVVDNQIKKGLLLSLRVKKIKIGEHLAKLQVQYELVWPASQSSVSHVHHSHPELITGDRVERLLEVHKAHIEWLLVLKYKYIFQIKYTEAILSNSSRKLLWFEISKMLMYTLKNKLIVSFIIIFGTLSFRISYSGVRVL